jgi:hypothetical protein
VTVHILTIEWRNWSRDIYAFSTREALDQKLLELAEVEPGTASGDHVAQDLRDHDHSVFIDTLEVEGGSV